MRKIAGYRNVRHLVYCRDNSAFWAMLVATLGLATASFPANAEDAAPSPYAATLAEHGITTDAAGLGSYLKQLHPDAAQRRAAQELIDQLSSEKFAAREMAMQRLMALPVPPTEALRLAAENRDPEVRWRAMKILAVEEPQRRVVMHAVFKTIEREQVKGLTADLVRAVALCEKRHLQLAVQGALRATAAPEDAALLRKAIESEDKQVVIAALGALGSALGEDAGDDLRKLLEHDNEAVNLAAARALADQGDRSSLAPLVTLLGSDSLDMRVGAAQTLRQATDTRHNYLAYEDVEERKKAIDRWAAWVESEGRTAKLHFPLKHVRFELGRTLITVYQQNKVFELDAAGKQVWEKAGLQQPWATTGLPNGHRLISEYSGRSVVEFDAGGKEVWRKKDLPASPFNIQRLDNGNTLIACSDSQKVVEVRPDGSTAWEITINGRPMDVRRLDNGRTLIALQNGNRVVEVDRTGKVLWEITSLKSPITAQRLENGNTLIAEVSGQRVAEWDRSGKVVWEHIGLRNPYSGERLSNGNTLIVHNSDVREVDRTGKIIWKKDMGGLAHATRY